MCNKKHARRYIDSLIDSFLREEIIPDILIDVLSHKSFLVCIAAAVLWKICMTLSAYLACLAL